MTDTKASSKKFIRCSKCGAPLPYGAKFCDICGEPCDSVEHLKFEKRRRTIVVLAVSAVLVFVTVSRMLISISGTKANRTYSLADVKDQITIEEYNSIELGMSKEEVVSIIGCEGKEVYDRNYRWPGIYYDDERRHQSYAEMDFNEEGELTKKEEQDILEAEEIQKTRALIPDNAAKIESPLVTARQLERLEDGMEYNEVVSILGGEGMLISSSSLDWVHNGYEKGPSDYVYKCKSKGKDYYVSIVIKNNRLYFKPDRVIIDSID